MKRLIAMVVTAGAALTAAAMPTKAELQKAQEMVTDVTAADVAALKAKTKTPAEVAAKHMELAGQAGSEAEKYLLLQAAFKLYAKVGDYEGAANALGTMNREIVDMKPEVIVEIYNRAIFSSMKEKAPKLHAIKEAARRQVTYRKLLAKAEAAVKANPKDPAAQKKLGECHAELGNWSKALDAFALAGGALAKTAAAEKDGTAAPQVSGDFWWDYESGDEMSTYKLHAAELYRTALADDSFKGLARTRTEQRVKEADAVAADLPRTQLQTVVGVPSVSFDTFKPKPDSPFQIRGNEATLDLGQGYGKLEFVKCPAGPLNFFLCKQPKEIVKTTISRPFWIMKRPIMRKELQRVLKSENDSMDYAALKGDRTFKGVENFNAIFGKYLPSGMVIRLPSLAEFQYAYLADPTDTTEVNDVVSNYAARRSCLQRDKKSEPNAWGLYDFNGERMCDLFTKDAVEPQGDWAWDDAKPHLWRKFKQLDSTVDPFYYGEGQIVRNVQFIPKDPGGWMAQCSSEWSLNFRLVIGPDLVSEWRARHSNSAGKKANEPQMTAQPEKKEIQTLPPVKPSGTRPADKKFNLAKGIDVEMIGCPAGEFIMGESSRGQEFFPHNVKISRPFWLSKTRVTFEQYETFKKTGAKEKELEKWAVTEALGGRQCPVWGITYEEFLRFCEVLTRKHKGKIPKGYVFRPPTEAEWEYAYRTDATDENDPHCWQTCDQKLDQLPLFRPKKVQELADAKVKAMGIDVFKMPDYWFPSPKVGTQPPNKWGVCDLLDFGLELTLDTIDRSKNVNSQGGWHWHLVNPNNQVFHYELSETDPLKVFESKGGADAVTRLGMLRKFESVARWFVCRLCLGPDLIAEKKAKK